MTEEEAKKKVCPYKILAWAMNKCDANCEGAGCMMWRWGKQEEIEIDRGYGQPPDTDVVDSGYCGLGCKQ